MRFKCQTPKALQINCFAHFHIEVLHALSSSANHPSIGLIPYCKLKLPNILHIIYQIYIICQEKNYIYRNTLQHLFHINQKLSKDKSSDL